MKFRFIIPLTLAMIFIDKAICQTNSPDQQFQQSTENWKNANNSGDAKNLQPLYAENARYLSSHVSGLEAIGRENVIANFQKGISSGGRIDSIRILSVETSGGLAYILTQYQATNSGQTVEGRNLLVLRKVKKKWVIVVHMTVV